MDPFKFALIMRSQIERQLQEHFGAACWLKLYAKTKELLVDAEFTYSRCHLDLGTNIRNVAPVSIAYGNALEAELVRRYRPVLQSAAYQLYKSQNRLGLPTLGSVIHLAANHERLPADLKQEVKDAGLRLDSDSELIGWLRGFGQARNQKVAHPSESLASHFLELREISLRIYPRLLSLVT